MCDFSEPLLPRRCTTAIRALVFTIFGREMLVTLANIGLRTTLFLLSQLRCGMLGHDAVFFAAINGGDAHG
jgi:hypothetical protein